MFDLRTRRRLGQYEHKLATEIFCCAPVNCGVAVAHGMVYLATLDARLVALDAATGELLRRSQPFVPQHNLLSAPNLAEVLVAPGPAGGTPSMTRTDAYAECATLPGTRGRLHELRQRGQARAPSCARRLERRARRPVVQRRARRERDESATVTMVAGWTIRARFANTDQIPHSMLVIRVVVPIPAVPSVPAIPGAASSPVASGIAARDLPDELTFTPMDRPLGVLDYLASAKTNG